MVWLLALLSLGAGVPLALALPDVWPHVRSAPQAVPFAWGALGGAAATLVVLRVARMVPILEHELTHLLVALLLFRRPLAIEAREDGGEAVYTGRGSTLIRLAPYVLPTFTLLGLGLAQLADPRFGRPIVVALGATWGFHVLTGLAESGPDQPDLREGGLVPSYAAVVGLGAILYPLAALGSIGGLPLVRRWLGHALVHAERLLG